MFDGTDFTNYNQMLKSIYRCSNLEDLRSTIMDNLSLLVPYDSAAFFEVNPVTREFKEPFHKNMDASYFNQYKSFYEDKDLYKKTVFSDGIIPIIDRSSDYMDYRQWERNEHRVDFLLSQKIYHISCLQIINDNKLVGEISLHRSQKNTDFDDSEMNKLKILHDHINNAFSIASMLNSPSPSQLVESNSKKNEMGICLLNSKFKLVGANTTTLNTLSQKLLTGQNVFQHLLVLCKDIAQGSRMNSLTETYTFSGILDLKDDTIPYRVVYIKDGQGEANYVFMIILRTDIYGSGLTISQNQSFKLTPREQEIVTLVAMGNTNKEIAQKLYLSTDTVKTYLKRLFIKAEVSSRTELVYKLWELSNGNYQLFSFDR